MAHMLLQHKETGQVIDVWSVDAKELLASGEYTLARPELGAQEGIPGEVVNRPFDPTLHRESPASRVGDVVVTTPSPEQRAAAEGPPQTTGAQAPAPTTPPTPAPATPPTPPPTDPAVRRRQP